MSDDPMSVDPEEALRVVPSGNMLVSETNFRRVALRLQYQEALISLSVIKDGLELLPYNTHEERKLYKALYREWGAVKAKLTSLYQAGDTAEFETAIAELNLYTLNIQFRLANFGFRAAQVGSDVKLIRYPKAVREWILTTEEKFTHRKVMAVQPYYFAPLSATETLPVFDNLFGEALVPYIDTTGKVMVIDQVVRPETLIVRTPVLYNDGSGPKTYYCIGNNAAWSGSDFEEQVRNWNDAFRGINYRKYLQLNNQVSKLRTVIARFRPAFLVGGSMITVSGLFHFLESLTVGALEKLGFIIRTPAGRIMHNNIRTFDGDPSNKQQYNRYLDEVTAQIISGGRAFTVGMFMFSDFAFSVYQLSITSLEKIVTAFSEMMATNSYLEMFFHIAQNFSVKWLSDLQLIKDIGSMLYVCSIWGAYISSFNLLVELLAASPMVRLIPDYLAKFKKVFLLALFIGGNFISSAESMWVSLLTPLVLGAVCEGLRVPGITYNMVRFYNQGDYYNKAAISKLVRSVANVMATNAVQNVGASSVNASNVVTSSAPRTSLSTASLNTAQGSSPTHASSFTAPYFDSDQLDVDDDSYCIFFGSETTRCNWLDRSDFHRQVMKCYTPEMRNVKILAFIPQLAYRHIDGKDYAMVQDIYNKIYLLDLSEAYIDEHNYPLAGREFIQRSLVNMESAICPGNVFYAQYRNVIPFYPLEDKRVERQNKKLAQRLFGNLSFTEAEFEKAEARQRKWQEKARAWSEAQDWNNRMDADFTDSPFGQEFISSVLAKDPMLSTARRSIHMLVLASFKVIDTE